MAGKKPEPKAAKKKGMGCLARLFVFLIVIIVAGYAAAKMFFPAERVRAEIVERASEKLGRTVELDNVSLSILPRPSLNLQGLRIYNPENFPGGDVVSLEELGLTLKIIPLLRGQFQFTEISADRPILHLRKTEDGRTNYSFDIKTDEGGIETPLGKKETVTSEEAALTVFAFDWAEVNNADIIYIDDSAGTRTVLNNVTLESRLTVDNEGKTGRSMGTIRIPSITSSYIPEDIPLAVNMSFNADIDFQHADLVFKNSAIEVNGIVFNIDATIRNILDPVSIYASLKADGVEMEPLVQYLPPSENLKKGDVRIQGKLNGEIESRLEFGSERTPYFSGNLTMRDLTLGYKTVTTRMHFDEFRLGFTFDSVWFESSGGRMSESDLYLSGMVKNWEDPLFNVNTRGTFLLSGLLPFMDPAYNHKISGTLRFDLSAAGQKSIWPQTRIDGVVKLKDGYYHNDSLVSPLERLDAELTFTGKGVTVDTLYAEYPGIRTSLTGTMKHGFAHLVEPRAGHKKPYLDFRMHAPYVNYDVLVPEEEAEAAAASVGGSVDMAAPIFLPDIEAGGKVAVDTLVYSKIELTDITGDVTFKDGVIAFKRATGKVYTGSVSGEGTIDITDFYKPVVTCDVAADDIEANDFLARFANLDGHLYGKIDMKGQLTGEGTEIDEFVRSMIANGDVSMDQGRVVNFELIKRMAGQFGFKTFEEQSLQGLAGKIKVENGRLLIDGGDVSTQIGDWDIGGAVGFLDRTLNLDVNVYLTKEYAQNAVRNLSDLGSLLLDDKGRLAVGFTIGGGYTNPTISNISVSRDAVKDNVQDKIKNGAEKLLKDIFKKP